MAMTISLMVSSAIFDNDGRMLVARRSQDEEFLPGYWTIIGGKFEEQDATIEAGVQREAKEETGMDVEIVRPINVEEFRRDDKPGMVAVEVTFLCHPKVLKDV